MLTSEKLLRLKIYEQRLLRAEEQTAEATLERLQRGAALREQEAEHLFNSERREAIRVEAKSETEWRKQSRRPCMFVGTHIYFDEEDEMFVCQHAGVVACGDTPTMACDNFDHLWVFGK